MNSKALGVYTFFYNYINWGTRFFDLRVLTAAIMLRMVPPVLPRRLAAVWNYLSNVALNFSFGRGRKMTYLKASKKVNQKPSNTISISWNFPKSQQDRNLGASRIDINKVLENLLNRSISFFAKNQKNFWPQQKCRA